jgi:hypothetical protein
MSMGTATAAESRRARQGCGLPDWILAIDAARILATHSARIRDLADRGLIGRRALPGTFPRYYRPDCEALARQSTTEARAGGQGQPAMTAAG